MPVFQLNPECCIGEVFKNLALHFDDVFFRHESLTSSTANQTRTLEICFFQQALVLMRHYVSLYLGHEIHCHYHDNQ